MNLSLALAQMQVVHGDFRQNTARAAAFIEQAKKEKADVIVFPELWTAGFDYSDCRTYSQANLEYLDRLQQTVDQTGLSIGGSYLIEENQSFYNQFVFLQPDSPRTIYSKIHLFHLMEEDLHLSRGSRISLIPSRWGLIQVAVCYDLRFPEMFRLAREKAAALVILSAGWPLARIDHWKVLVRARAIENQCFFAAVNCVGGQEKAAFGGASMVVGPWGDVIVEGETIKDGLLHANIDLDDSVKVRTQYPFFDDRLDHYG